MSKAVVAAAICAVVVAVPGCTRSSGKHSTSSIPTTTSPVTSGPHRVVVSNRAAAPTETDAPGIQYTQGNIEVTVAGHRIVVAAEDWNTISAESVVPHDIGVSLDPDFHAAQTTRNRFQYLADLMAQYAPDQFDPVGVVAAPQSRTLVAIVALINATPHTYRLSDLRVVVTDAPPLTTLGSATFYTGAGNALIIPGRGIYFARFKLPLAATPPTSANTMSFNFHYGRLYDCGTNPC